MHKKWIESRKTVKKAVIFLRFFIFLGALFLLVYEFFAIHGLVEAIKNCLYYSPLDFNFIFTHIAKGLVYIEPEVYPLPLKIQIA